MLESSPSQSIASLCQSSEKILELLLKKSLYVKVKSMHLERLLGSICDYNQWYYYGKINLGGKNRRVWKNLD